jgi:hypothetical protein
MRPAPSRLTIGQQIIAMRSRFPQFAFRRVSGRPTWIGDLQPDPESAIYRVRITMCPPKSPRVCVTTPALRRDAPHIYPDRYLCLHYPPDESWQPSKFIADTIVPWAAYWLACYELWLLTGEWYGPEAPHGRHKRRE